MKNRVFNIFSVAVILCWILADRYFRIGSPAYGWILLVYVSVIFCGSYFIQWDFFLPSVHGAKTKDQSIALTFDDGPSGAKTAQILDILKENHLEAAFFCIGKNLYGNEGLLKRMVVEGHMIGNHSYSHHPLFDLFSSRKMLGELQEMSRDCYSITGLSPRFFRPPYGITNPNLKNAVLAGGFVSIGWSVRSFDTVIRNEERLLKRILKALQPGAILLLHDTSETTRAILPRLLKGINDKGYKIVRLDKMINLNPYD